MRHDAGLPPDAARGRARSASLPPAGCCAPPLTRTAVPGDLPDDPFTLGVCAGDPDASSAVLWTRLTAVDGAPLPAGDVVVTWELANDPDFSAPIASGDTVAAAADGHSVHVVVDVAGPSWYRFRAGGWTSPVGRVAPAVGEARCASRPPRASTSRPATTRRTATSPSGRPISWCSSATSSTRGHHNPSAATACGSHRGDEPRRPRRLPRPLRPVPRRRRSAGGTGGGAVVGDLGRPRGREQLRRAHVRGRRPGRRVPQPPAGRLPGVVGAHAGAHPDAAGGCRHDHLPHDLVGHARRLHPARRAAVPQRPGVRRRRPRPRAGVPRSERSGTHDARHRAGAMARRTAAPRRRRRGR